MELKPAYIGLLFIALSAGIIIGLHTGQLPQPTERFMYNSKYGTFALMLMIFGVLGVGLGGVE